MYGKVENGSKKKQIRLHTQTEKKKTRNLRIVYKKRLIKELITCKLYYKKENSSFVAGTFSELAKQRKTVYTACVH